MNPAQRTLKYLRSLGYTAEVVERWIQGANVRKDLFGFIDIVAIGVPFVSAERGHTIGVQATTTKNLNARARKIFSEPSHRTWLDCGNRIILVGWSKKGPRGKRKLWTPEVREFTATSYGFLANTTSLYALAPDLGLAPGSGSPETEGS